MSQKLHQTATAEPARTDTASATSGAAASGNAETEEAAARARLKLNLQWVPSAWIELGKDLFRDALTVEQVPDEAAFRAGAYKLIADLHHNVAPMLEVLACSPDRKPFLDALQAVDAAGKADAAHLRAIETDVKDLAAGGDVSYNTRELLAHYAPLSALGKGWLGGSPLVATTFATYVNGGECHRHGVLARSYSARGTLMEHAIVQAAQRDGDARVDAVRRLMMLLTKGTLGVGPITETPVVEDGAAKEAADAAQAADLAAIDAEVAKLEARIRAAVKSGKKHDGVRTVDDKTFKELKADLEAADPRVRDRIYADGELMNHLTQSADARQVQELVHAVDSVEALYQACLKIPPPPSPNPGIRVVHATKEPFQLVRDYLLERSAPEQKEARMRVLRHEQLKTAAIDPMTDDDRRLIFRLITRGTMEPTPEDRVHEAAKAGDGAAMARALMQLASEDPGQLAALKQDQLFWKSVEQLDKDIVVDGMTVNPFSLCLTMWGIEPRSSKDPGAEELHGTVNLTGDNRPLKIEERIKLDEELFGPTIRSLYSEFCETIVDDDDCVSIMRRFEEKALQKEYSDLLHRAKEAPGPTLEKKYDAVHSPLRNELSEYTEGNERRECERIVGVRLEATVGTIGGNVRLASDKDKGAMQLEQAVRETAHEGKPLTQWVSRCVDTFIEETYVPPEVNGISYGGGSAFGDLEEVLSAWNRWKDIFEQHKGALSALTGIAPGALHAIELLGNAFRMRSGELGARMNRCFGGKEREQVLTAMGLRAEDVGQRQMAGNTELMKTDPAAAIAQQADMLWKEPAQEIFEAIGTLSVGEDAEIDALATRLTAATAKGIEPPSDEAAAAKFATIAEDQQPRSFSAYYRKHNGIDYKLHIARVISASPGAWALGAIASKLGVDSSLIGPATAPPKDSLVVDETNQHLVRPDFTAARAEALGKQIWEIIHGSGEVHLIMSQLYGKYTPEEQRLISVAFQQLSGGIDVAFYLRQEMLVRKEGSDVTQVGGEGTEAGKAAVGGKTELNIEGDQTKLESALMVATTGELDNHARFKAAVANHDMNQLFRVCDDCSESECRKILGDSALMDAAYKACDQYAWDRVSKTLTGQSDLMDRLYSRAHGAYDSWNPFDCTDEAGIREDVKSYVQRLRRKFDKDLRASGKGTDPKKLQKDIEDKVRDACQRLMANPNVRGLIEDELSGSELAEVEGLILNGGEDSTKSDIAREGEEASTIIAGIRALKPEQKAPLRNDPEYLEKLAYRLTKPEDYREAMDLLMSDQSGQGGLADLDKAVNPHNDEDHDTRSAKKALLALSEAEYRQLAADPALQARILASIGNEKDRAMIREMISLRLPDVGKDLADADRQAAADASRLAYLKHSAVQRIQFATTLGWDTMLAQCVEVFQMDFAPAAVQAKPGADGEPPPDPSVQLAAAKAAGEKTRAEVWAAVEGDVASFSRKTVKDTRQTMSTISDAGAMTKLIRAAVMGVTDPSAERIKENLVGEKQITYGGETHTYRDASDNDQKGLLATLNAASPDLLIAEWTSVTQTRANGGESMQAVYQRFATTEDVLSKKIEAAQQGEADEKSTKVESPLTAAERQAYQIEKLAFLNYVPGISDGFERMLLPYVGDENDATASGDQAQKREDLRTRDNKKYNELLDAIGSRAQGLPKAHTAKVATAIGASTPAHQKLIDNQNRESLGQLELREQKYLQQRGTQAGSGWAASDEAEALDQAMVRYSREAAMAQVTQDGQQDAYGMITAAEGAKIEEKGEEFDRAHQAFKDAKAKVAMWMSLIIGVLVTCILTVLTGGAATGFAAMLFWSAVTAGASAAAKAAINEAVLGSDYDFTDEGVKMIGKEMLTAVITAGTTFVAQKMVAGLSGATTLSRQARAAEQTMRVKPPLWKSFLNEGSEEILSETMSGTIEAGLIAIDPTHWMHGVVEGQDRALPEAWAKLSSVPGGALRGGITSIVTSGATRVLGAKKGQLQDLAHASRGKKINIRENFATVFGDQREAMIATFTEFAIAKIGGEKFDIENVPGELLQGYLQEMNEKSVEMHTGTAHKGKRGDRAQADVKKYEHLLTKQEQTDFLKMNEGAEATDTYITPADYVGVRHRMATDALGAWSERTGQQLTPDQAQGFIMFVRGAKDADELQVRLQMDPKLAAAATAIDAQGFDPSKRIMYVPDAQLPTEQTQAPAVVDPRTAHAQQTQATQDAANENTLVTPTAEVTQVTAAPVSAPRAVATDFADLASMTSVHAVIIAGHQVARVEPLLNAMSDEDYRTFQGILASVPGQTAHAFLYKAVAAGNRMAEIQWMAGFMVGKDDAWLVDALTLGDFRGQGIGVQQQWSMSCNASTTITMRGNYDPVFALQTRLYNTNINQVDYNDPTVANPHLAGMEKALLESAYQGAAFPSLHGSQGEAKAMNAGPAQGRFADDILNQQSDATGLQFTTMANPSAAQALATLTSALSQGMQVPVVIGDGPGQYTHYVLCQGSRVNPSTGQLEFQFHNTGDGTTSWVSSAQILTGSMGLAGGDMITVLEVPSAIPVGTAAPVPTATSAATTQVMPAVTAEATAASAATTQVMPAVTQAEIDAASEITQEMPAVTPTVASAATTQVMPAVTTSSMATTQVMPAVTQVEIDAASEITQEVPAVTATDTSAIPMALPDETTQKVPVASSVPAVVAAADEVTAKHPAFQQAVNTIAAEVATDIVATQQAPVRDEAHEAFTEQWRGREVDAVALEEQFTIEYEDALEKVQRARAKEGWADVLAGVSDEELAAIVLYTATNFVEWNDTLRSRDQGRLEQWGLGISMADRGLSRLPAHEGWVHRGVESLPAEVLAKYEIGKTVTEEAFTSSSYEQGAQFTGKVQFNILSKEGRRIDALSRSESEKEVLFRPNSKFIVTDKIQDGDVVIITMEEIVISATGEEIAASGNSPDAIAQAETSLVEVRETLATVDQVTGVDKGQDYADAQAQLRAFYAQQEVEAQNVVPVRGFQNEENIFAWNYGHDLQQFSHGLVNASVRIHIGSTNASEDELVRFRRNVVAGVDKHFNHGHTIKNAAGQDSRLHVEVLFVDDASAAHFTIEVLRGDGGAHLKQWFVEGDQTTHAHELGHGAFGLLDEYWDQVSPVPPSGRAHANAPNVRVDHSLMGNYWQQDASGQRVADDEATLHQRHLDWMSTLVSWGTGNQQARMTVGGTAYAPEAPVDVMGGRFGTNPDNGLELMTDTNPPPEVVAVQTDLARFQSESMVTYESAMAFRRLVRELRGRRDAEIDAVVANLAGTSAGQVDRAAIATVFDYLFDSEGIASDYLNYAGWRRVAAGMATVDDVRFLVHELEEQRAFERAGFDNPLGRGFEGDDAARDDWRESFDEAYMPAHREALATEAQFLADEVARLTDGALILSAGELAASDPTRGEMIQYMLVDGVPAVEHGDAPTWDRRDERVVLPEDVAARLGLPTSATVANIIVAVKRASA